MRALLFVLVLLAGCAPESGSASQAVHNGQEAPELDAVVALLADGALFCTGTVIAPRVVLTAAHCVDRYVSDDTTVIEVFFGARLDRPGTRIVAEELVRHADWRFDALPNDIALVALTGDAPVEPIPASTVALTGDIVDTEVTLVGFGITELGAEDSGVRRLGLAPITGIDDQRMAINGGPTAGSVCAGDSGGPTLLDGRVIGVHSRSSCSTLSLDERVDVHQALIDPFVAAHPALGDGGCNSSGGAPPLWLALAMLAVRRRTRPRGGR